MIDTNKILGKMLGNVKISKDKKSKNKLSNKYCNHCNSMDKVYDTGKEYWCKNCNYTEPYKK